MLRVRAWWSVPLVAAACGGSTDSRAPEDRHDAGGLLDAGTDSGLRDAGVGKDAGQHVSDDGGGFVPPGSCPCAEDGTDCRGHVCDDVWCTVTARIDGCDLVDNDCDGLVDEDVAEDAGDDDAGCL